MPEIEVVMSEDVYFSQFYLGIADVGKRPRVSSIPICDELEIHCRTGVGQGKAKRVDTKIRIAKAPKAYTAAVTVAVSKASLGPPLKLHT